MKVHKQTRKLEKQQDCKCDTNYAGYICDAHAAILFGVCKCERCSKRATRLKERLRKSQKTILEEALEITSGARPSKYGTPKRNHTRTAKLWSVYLGIEITPRQVCILNMLQKISRDMHSPQRDNLVDIAGFAQNADAIENDCS